MSTPGDFINYLIYFQIESFSTHLWILYTHTQTHTHTHTHTYIYIYIERERGRERQREYLALNNPQELKYHETRKQNENAYRHVDV